MNYKIIDKLKDALKPSFILLVLTILFLMTVDDLVHWKLSEKFLGDKFYIVTYLFDTLAAVTVSFIILKYNKIQIDKIRNEMNERKIYEQELFTSREEYKMLTNRLPYVILRLDRDLRISFVNDYIEKITNTPAKDFIGMALNELKLNQEQIEFLSNELNSVFISKEEKKFEIKWEDEGRTYYFECYLTPQPNLIGEVDSIFVICRDITDWKAKAEEISLKAKIIDSFHDVIFLLDRAGNIKFASKSACDSLGYSEDDLSKMNIKEISSAKHADKVDERITKIFTGEISMFETEHIKKDGSKLPVEVSARVIQSDGDTYILGLGRNISEREEAKKIQNALFRISESVSKAEDLNSLFNIIHNIISDLVQVKNFYIALYDDAKGILSFPYFIDEYDSPPEPRGLRKGLTELVLETGTEWLVKKELDLELQRVGRVESIGEQAAIWLGIPLKINDKVFGVLVVQDYNDESTYGQKELKMLKFVSEQISYAIDKKKKEEELKKYSKELEELVAIRDKLLSIISHDLRSPFNSMIGYTDLLLANFKDFSSNELKDIIKSINTSLKDIYQLAENLLEWSVIQMGDIQFKLEKLNLAELISVCRNVLKGNAITKDIELCNNVNGDIFIYADKNAVNSVIQNLISNAIKFSNSGGKVEIDCNDADDFVEFSIKDEGIGMDIATKNNLFDSSKLVSRLGTANEKGLGLGLKLCKNLVENLGGKIWVESELGKGSVFKFTVRKWSDGDE